MKWQIIKDYPNYIVSDQGIVKNIKSNRILKFRFKFGNYLGVVLYKNGKPKDFFIHTLVLEAFKGKRPNGKQANHKNCDKTNNWVNNLEWLTPKENIIHAHKNGLMSAKGEDNSAAKLKQQDVESIKILYANSHFSYRDIANLYNVGKTTIAYIIQRKSWCHVT